MQVDALSRLESATTDEKRVRNAASADPAVTRETPSKSRAQLCMEIPIRDKAHKWASVTEREAGWGRRKRGKRKGENM